MHPFQAGDQSKRGSCSTVYLCRDTKSTAQLEKEKTLKQQYEKEGTPGKFSPKKYDYFVLSRVSPLDQVKIGGDVSLTAMADQDQSQNPAIGFRLGGGKASNSSHA